MKRQKRSEREIVKRAFKFALVAFSVIFLSVPLLAKADNIPLEQFYDQGPSIKNVGGYSGVLVDDTELITNQLSNLVGVYTEQKNNIWIQKEAFVCRSWDDAKCSAADNVWYNAVLDYCKTELETNCIAGVSAVVDGKEIIGKFQGNYPTSSEYTFKGDSSQNIPDGKIGRAHV